MILVTRLDRQIMLLNPDHIVTIEETPDTVITLFNGHHLLVRERANVLFNRIVAYRSRLIHRSQSVPGSKKYLERRNRRAFRTQPFVSPRPDAGQSPFHRQDS